MVKSTKTIFALLMLFSLCESCLTYDKLLYFRTKNEQRPTNLSEEIQNLKPLTIRTNDVLTVTVHTLDPKLSAPFNLVANQPLGSAVSGDNASPLAVYMVDENGNIEFPVLGLIQVRGKTVSEAKALIETELKTYLKEPIVNMRIANFRVSVLGEVSNPGTFIINNDRITVLEALGMAGDLTPYSNRTNILVVREQGGQRQFGELNLQSVDIFRSEYYYLRQGDIVYVEPTEEKEGAIRDKVNETIPWISAAISAIATTITVIVVATR